MFNDKRLKTRDCIQMVYANINRDYYNIILYYCVPL